MKYFSVLKVNDGIIDYCRFYNIREVLIFANFNANFALSDDMSYEACPVSRCRVMGLSQNTLHEVMKVLSAVQSQEAVAAHF